jgi:hypothetical protein
MSTRLTLRASNKREAGRLSHNGYGNRNPLWNQNRRAGRSAAFQIAMGPGRFRQRIGSLNLYFHNPFFDDIE